MKKNSGSSSKTSTAASVAAPAPSSTSSATVVTAGDFLFGPGECDEPIPTPALERRYRFNSLVYLPPVDGLPIAPPATTGSMLTRTMLAETHGAAATVADFLEGVPINAMSTVAPKGGWTQPLYREVSVLDIADFARTGVVAGRASGGKIAVTAYVLKELAAGREVLAAVEGAPAQRLRMRAAASAVRAAPKLVEVQDVPEFCTRSSVVLPGIKQPVTLNAAQKRNLTEGRPVSVGRGRDAVIFLGSAPAMQSMQSASVASTFEGGVGVVVVGSPPPATSPPPVVVTPGTNQPVPPPPRSSTGGTHNVPPPPKPSVEVAFLVPYEQRWTLKTYERGELISCIALTPLEELTIEIFSWDRRKSSVEDTSASEAERVAEGQSVDRDTRDVFSELTRNSTFNWGLKAELSAGVPGKLGGSVGGSAGGSNTLNDVARRTAQSVQEQTVKATEKVKWSRQTKITESVEEGSETRTTRKLRNGNQAYPVHYNYFEVLARYVVRTDCLVDEIAPVVTVEAPSGRLLVDYDFVRSNETILRRGLLSNTLAPGFDAARMLWTRELACDELCRQCLCTSPLPSAASPAFAAAAAAATALARAIARMPQDSAAFQWNGFFNAYAPLPMGSAAPVGTTYDDLRRVMFIVALESFQPGLWAAIQAPARALVATTSPTADQVAAFYTPFATFDPATLDQALAPDATLQGVLQSYVGRCAYAAYPTGAQAALDSLIANHLRGSNQVLDVMIDGIARFPRSGDSTAVHLLVSVLVFIAYSRIGFTATLDAGIRNLIQPAKDAIKAWLDERGAQDQATRTAEAAAKAAREASIAAMFPPTKVLAARERFDALKRHIEDNNDYYAFMLLTDQIARGRYVAPPMIGAFYPAVLPRPVAVVNGRLCFPIDPDAPGMASVFAQLAKMTTTVKNDGKEVEVKLPTPGFVVEPKLSMCSAAEPFIEEARRIDLQQRQALADQAHDEAKRRGLRLSGANPTLDPFDPAPATIRVVLDKPAP